MTSNEIILTQNQVKELKEHITATNAGLMKLYDGLSHYCLETYNLMDEVIKIREKILAINVNH